MGDEHKVEISGCQDCVWRFTPG